MLVVNTVNTLGKTAIEDVINHGKTCNAVPSFPAPSIASKDRIVLVSGAKDPTLIAGKSLLQLKPNAKEWHASQILQKPIIHEFKAFQLKDDMLVTLPLIYWILILA